jgi:RecA/RadA recombinase
MPSCNGHKFNQQPCSGDTYSTTVIRSWGSSDESCKSGVDSDFSRRDSDELERGGKRMAQSVSCESIPCDETAKELKRRKRAHALKFGVDSLDQITEFQCGLFFPLVCDIVGPCGSGKTEILLHLCVNSTSPRSHEGIYIGGNEASVLFICMGQAPGELLPRLITLFDLFARKSWESAANSRSPPESWIESLVLDSMSRVHFVHCSSSLQVLAAAHCAETLIKTEAAMSAILVDSLSAFQVYQ